ncbi:PHP domain-containing protein [Candidatus Pacebacteria bacterium]|nr:PHP domain-containing protein [Candidatus Paceibacterota bacterium]
MKYTGVVHMHSTYSYDGKVSLPDLKQLLMKEGISFACMTEHSNEMTKESATHFVEECRRLSDESFVFVPGFEVPYKDPKVFHVLMIGATEFVCAYAHDAQALRAWASCAGLVVLPHPVRNKFQYDETLLDIADGVEIWNQQYDGKCVPRTGSYKLLQTLRKEKPSLFATGALDFHRVEHLTYPRYQIEVDAVSEASIIDALVKAKCTFGNHDHTINPTGDWEEANSVMVRVSSIASTTIIYISKKISKGLAHLGLRFPKSIKRAIRSRV